MAGARRSDSLRGDPRHNEPDWPAAEAHPGSRHVIEEVARGLVDFVDEGDAAAAVLAFAHGFVEGSVLDEVRGLGGAAGMGGAEVAESVVVIEAVARDGSGLGDEADEGDAFA
ncbi:MAG: hypothetical protein U0Q16_26235 [Bryobacteraceae bacterium]